MCEIPYLKDNITRGMKGCFDLNCLYFSNIVESASRDLHCFIVQANTSKYGDSRITGPYNSLFKDIIKVKGGENNVLLIGTVDCLAVREKRQRYP